MRAPALVCVTLMMATALVMNTGVVGADLAPIEGGITILYLSGDAWRSEDNKSVFVQEGIFHNNSGAERFSGNFSLWIQQGARISSNYCGSQTNMISIMKSGPLPTCIPLRVIDSENFEFMPFSTGEFLSYYGEKHAVSLNASLTNASGQMDFEVTVGVNSKTSPRSVIFGNVSMNTTRCQIGTQAYVDWAPPRNLTIRETVSLSNSGGNTENVNLALLGLPSGWNASIWRGGMSVTSVQIPATGLVSIVLNLTVPSHILWAYVNYQLQGTDKPNGESTVTIVKILPYNTTTVDFRVYAQSREEVTATGRLVASPLAHWDDRNQMTYFPVRGDYIKRGELSMIVDNWRPPPWEVPLFAIAAVFLLLILLIIIILMRKRRLGAESDEEAEAEIEEEPSTKPAAQSLSELRQERDTLRKSLDRLGQDEKEGSVPKDIVAKMKQDVQTELTQVEQELNVLASVTTRKKAILKAMRRLEKDFKEGRVDKEVYTSLKARYEKEAVGILKQIDELKKQGVTNDDADEQ